MGVAIFALASCRHPVPVRQMEEARYRDLLIDPGPDASAAGIVRCADVTGYGVSLTDSEPILLRQVTLDAPSELLLRTCREEGAAFADAGIVVEVFNRGRRKREVHALGVPPGWSEHRIALAPRDAEARIRLSAAVPPGLSIVVGDLAVLSRQAVPAASTVPRAILISLDAFREDAIGALGGGARTPVLDQLLVESERFYPHWSQEISTKPSHASMLTGLPVEIHGCDRSDGPLPEAVRTLAERLSERSIDTAALTSVAPFFHRRYGLGQGFATYRRSGWTTRQELRSATTWLGDRRDRPAFLFVHLYAVHSKFSGLPYEAPGMTQETLVETFGPGDYRCREEHCASLLALGLNFGVVHREPTDGRVLRHLYDRGVEALDGELGVWFDELRSAGLWDDTLVVVTADHGEAFGEHGYFLHATAHEEVLRVPLLVKWSREVHAGRATLRPSTSLDLAPTLLAHFGLPANDLPGADLASPASRPAPVVSWQTIRDGDLKLLLETPEFPRALYDLAADPGERTNLLPEREADAARLERLRARYLERARVLAGTAAPGPPRPFTEEEEQQLRSLGYLR